MGRTSIRVGDPKACRKFGAFLAMDVGKQAYWNRFVGKEESDMPIWTLTDLENDAGDSINFDLSMRFKQAPTEGDDRLEGKEEPLKFASSDVQINQMRSGANCGGRMTRKRTIHNLRNVSRKRSSEWWSQAFDELIFIHMSGTRGINEDYLYPLGYPGFAGNALNTPDSMHLLMPKLASGVLATASTITNAETFSLDLIDRAVAHAQTMGAKVPRIQPLNIEGEKRHVCLMHSFQEYHLRTSTGEKSWLDIQKAMYNASGKNNPIHKGGLGMHNGVVLHKHESVVRMMRGASSDVACARALFLGKQAGVLAWGNPGSGIRFQWTEETRDNGNELVIATNGILGFTKTSFLGVDFGCISMDTAAPDPNK